MEFDIILKNVCKKYSKCTNDLQRLLVVLGLKENIKIKVLNNINLEIKKGEKVALIGKNGQGKSTLLKIISNITQIDEGEVHVNRRVSTLLEVHAGFYEEFTARENLFMRATLLGLNKKQIKKIQDDIFEFAGISDDFKDQQLKRFSSGMIAKLGFAINLKCNPEILIVDEALSVGDIEFKIKCEQAIKDLSKNNYITLLFVSHDQQVVEEFCTRGIVINDGSIAFDGNIKDAYKKYNSFFDAKTNA